MAFQIPLPPRIDPTVTMMTVEEKPDVTYKDVGGCKEQIEKLREVPSRLLCLLDVEGNSSKRMLCYFLVFLLLMLTRGLSKPLPRMMSSCSPPLDVGVRLRSHALTAFLQWLSLFSFTLHTILSLFAWLLLSFHLTVWFYFCFNLTFLPLLFSLFFLLLLFHFVSLLSLSLSLCGASSHLFLHFLISFSPFSLCCCRLSYFNSTSFLSAFHSSTRCGCG